MKGNPVNYIKQQQANNFGWVFKTPTSPEVVNNTRKMLKVDSA